LSNGALQLNADGEVELENKEGTSVFLVYVAGEDADSDQSNHAFFLKYDTNIEPRFSAVYLYGDFVKGGGPEDFPQPYVQN
jgi:hypothetical protein